MPLIIAGDLVKAEPQPPGKSFRDFRQEVAAQVENKNIQTNLKKIEAKKAEVKNAKRTSAYHRDMTTVHKV